METDHLPSSDEIDYTKIRNDAYSETPFFIDARMAVMRSGYLWIRPVDTGTWHEGKLVAKHIFQ